MYSTDEDYKPKVTIVDDEPWALDVMVRATQRWNFATQSASTAEQALLLLEKQLTPILVTDVRMPGRGGVWLVREVNRRWPEVGIIVVTAGHDTDIVGECLSAGAHHYFLKPINLDEFHHALESTARQYNEQTENNRYRRELELLVRQRTRQLRSTYLSAIESLVRTLEARDPYTSGHSIRVANYAVALAQSLKLDAKIIKKISLAAKLHDIGKVGLPEGILNKAGKLTEDEFSLVREHPQLGERILSPVIRSSRVLSAIRGHHERWDGNGYPDGLCGEKIPLAARVIAIADCFDAMTSTRAYRAAMSMEEALDIIRDGSGFHFDPNMVQPFINMIWRLQLA